MPLFKGIIDQSDEEIFDDIPDFHRQVKARLLKLGHTSPAYPGNYPRTRAIPKHCRVSFASVARAS